MISLPDDGNTSHVESDYTDEVEEELFVFHCNIDAI